MGLGVLADPLAVADQVVMGYVHAPQLQVEIGPPQPAQLTAARTGDGYEPQIGREFRMNLPCNGNDLRYLVGRERRLADACSWAAWPKRQGYGLSIPTAPR